MFRSGVDRIAVCFSGQPRTWRKCIDSWENILIHNGSSNHIDVFCHVWDFNTVSNAVSSEKTSERVSDGELKELISRLNPKKVLIESEKQFTPMHEEQAIPHSSWLSQYYGYLRAARLKREYEIENDLRYYAVVRSRYDSLYSTRVSDVYNNIQPNTMHGFHIGWDTQTNRGRIGDICWVADSDTYDTIADFYLNLQYINKKWFPDIVSEQVFFHYIKKNNINVTNNRWIIQLMRESEETSHTKTKDGYETW